MSKSLYTTIVESVAPTTETVGVVGQLYLDTSVPALYQCTAVDTANSSYTWTAVGGGSGVSQEDFDKLVNNETQIVGKTGIFYNFLAGGTNPTTQRGIAIGKDASLQGADNVVIGREARGYNWQGTNGMCVALGSNASCSAFKTYQLGQGRNKTPNTFQVANDNIYNHETHTATFQNLQIDGVDEYPTLSGADAPTTTTVGKVKQFYVETTTPALYYCSSVTGTGTTEDPYVYNWTQAGGADEELRNNTVQIVGENNSFSAGGANTRFLRNNAIAIGKDASGDSSYNYTIAIGGDAYAKGGISIGQSSQSTDGVTIGYLAKGIATDTIQLGSGTNSIANTLQIRNDNIYNHSTHTLTVQNIELNGTDINTVISNALPTLTSQLTNDSLYITNQVNDLANYYTKSNTYTKTEVDTKISDLIDSAPETLNTLNELAVAIQENDTLIDTLNDAIGTKANDNAVVHLIGDEIISGNKTFDSITLPNTKPIYAKLNNGQSVPIMNVSAVNNMTCGAQGIGYIAFYNQIQPSSANSGVIDIGSNASYWKDLYLTGYLRDGTNNIKVSEIANKSSLKTVATTGSYDDLTNKPDLTVYINKNVSDLTNYYTKTNIDTKLNDYSLKTHTHSYNDLTDKPDISSLQSTVTAVQNRIKITRIQ